MSGNRLDGQGDAVVFSALHHSLQFLYEGGESLLCPALRAELVLKVGSSCLGTYHATTKKGSKADMGIILLPGILHVFLIRICQIQIVPDYSNIKTVFLKEMPEIVGISWSQGSRCTWILLQCLRKSKMDTAEALSLYNRQKFRKTHLFCVMQSQSKLNHLFSPPQEFRISHHTGCCSMLVICSLLLR